MEKGEDLKVAKFFSYFNPIFQKKKIILCVSQVF